jgi:hypothetical protein
VRALFRIGKTECSTAVSRLVMLLLLVMMTTIAMLLTCDVCGVALFWRMR